MFIILSKCLLHLYLCILKVSLRNFLINVNIYHGRNINVILYFEVQLKVLLLLADDTS